MTEKNSSDICRQNRFSILLIILSAAATLLLFAACNKEAGPDIKASTTGVLSSRSASETDSLSNTSASTSAVITNSETAGSTKTNTTSSTSAASSSRVFSAADQRYFKDCVFIGDSITTGIKLYGITKNATVLAATGLNTTSAGRYIGDVSKMKLKYIYVLLGSNDIGFSGMTEDRFIRNYDIFVKALIKASPKSKIYLQSVFPVTSNYEKKMSRYKNEKIDSYNLRISQMAAENHVLYLNVSEALKDKNNDLIHSLSPYEGMHISPQGYYIWLHYVLQHRSA